MTTLILERVPEKVLAVQWTGDNIDEIYEFIKKNTGHRAVIDPRDNILFMMRASALSVPADIRIDVVVAKGDFLCFNDSEFNSPIEAVYFSKCAAEINLEFREATT